MDEINAEAIYSDLETTLRELASVQVRSGTRVQQRWGRFHLALAVNLEALRGDDLSLQAHTFRVLAQCQEELGEELMRSPNVASKLWGKMHLAERLVWVLNASAIEDSIAQHRERVRVWNEENEIVFEDGHSIARPRVVDSGSAEG